MAVWINKKINGCNYKGDTECAYPHPGRGIKIIKTGDAQGHIPLVLLLNA